MKQVEAHSCGSIWRADVFHAVQFGPVQVTDTRGNVLGTITKHSKQCRYYLNNAQVSYRWLWERMHKWSDVIAVQQSENYRERMKA